MATAIEDFQRGIESLSKRSSRSNAYPRPDLTNLSHFLNEAIYRPVAGSSSASTLTSSGSSTDDSFVVLHDLGTGNSTPYTATSPGLAAFEDRDLTQPNSSVVFLRGFPTAKWLTKIGQAFGVNPELYRRHLDFHSFNSGSRDLFSSPSLPSSSTRVFQLTISTICSRNVGASGYEPEDLKEARGLENEAMTRYFKLLRSRATPADSVVRKCLLLSKEEYVLEQKVSIEVGPPADNWRAVVWLDSGRDLSRSVPGPWKPRLATRAWETYFFPVIVHSAWDSRAEAGITQPAYLPPYGGDNAVNRNNGDQEEEWRAAQNISLLPFQYGSGLDKDLARRDALYALSDLFHFAAFAEVQFLNLLGRRIEHELSFVGADENSQYHSISLLNLKYIKTLLASHLHSLAEVASILRNRQSLDWPRVEDSSTTEKIAALLLVDFEYLLERAQGLKRECEHGMATLANSSVLEESRRSANMARTVQKLTIIGTVFIPLSFVCSVWGMNVKELGSGHQPMWMFAASLLPVVLLAYIIYNWEAIVRVSRHKKKGLA